MYELWLMLNILWETVHPMWPWLLAAVLVWLLLIGLARRGAGGARAALRPSLFAGAAAAVLAFLALPGLTTSSLVELGYWVDWLALGGMAAGAGVVTALFALPLVQLLCKPSATGHGPRH